MKPLLYKYKMASAPTQKDLSEGISEGGGEDFWCNTFSFLASQGALEVMLFTHSVMVSNDFTDVTLVGDDT